ncbi:aminoglycoside phosphotransferase family protein [Paramagnetospirillum magneticum]|uniref:Aminoglycoside phosphotransferase domain-containing protein n=1 Tax=Paramagnetospirillum magneticum (strain ATCC 700264 / AMB-1) TaxID=342108 RepID=Q2WBA6_PARM1|nr:aminoglycoside phosphotransferase family protein [Paramagnetospirillum magneticum]BAE48869.1 hypothetical protein amb0065 [Paramagnetospirillum magneticum AMB-1]
MTPSSPPPEDTAALAALVASLTGLAVSGVARGGQGGNNRLYRAETTAGPLAVKCYFRHPGDTRDRLAAEFAALRFLGECGVSNVPGAIAADAQAGVAIYDWIDGQPPVTRQPGDMAQLAGFVAVLRDLASRPAATALPLASEACLSAEELACQLEKRLARLNSGAGEVDSQVASFLDELLGPAVMSAVSAARGQYGRLGWDFGADLAFERQCLSPSDFGTHNALRRADGSLVFLDFEYFGWDDPVKLTADTLLHPGMELSEAERAEFKAATLAIHGGDGGFAGRLNILLPLYALRWALIVLNPFLPERWARLSFATGAERETVLRVQLAKARRFVAMATGGLDIDAKAAFIL